MCTAPLSHAAIIDRLLDADVPVFTELNLVADGYAALTAKAREKGLALFLSSTMLYRAETQYIKREVQAFAKPVNYVYHIASTCPTGTPGRITKTSSWATGARAACARSSPSICHGSWTRSAPCGTSTPSATN